MIKFKSTRSWMIMFGVITLCLVAFPRHFDQEDDRGCAPTGLRISVRENSPAYSAFLFSKWEEASNVETLQLETTPEEELRAGTSFKMALLNEELIPQEALPLIPETNPESSQLKGMIISGNAKAMIKEVAAVNWVNELKADLSPSQSRRLAAVEDWLKGKEWSSAPQVELPAEAAQPAPTDLGERVIPTAAGGSIYIGQNFSSSPTLANGPTRVAKKNSLKAHKLDSNPSPEPNPIDVDPNARRLALAGFIEMTGGLAYLGPENSLVVTQELGGKDIGSGTVWVSEGRFEISVEEAKGYLVAELRDATGGLVGRGSLDLYKLPPVPRNEVKVSNLTLKMTPVSKGVSVASLSAHSLGGYEIPSDGAHVYTESTPPIDFKKDLNKHHSEDFLEGSTALLKARAEESLVTTYVSGLSSEEKVFLFPKSYVKALVRLVSPSEADLTEEKGYIIGQVRDNGKSIAGAKIDVASDYQVKPVYFNEAFLPDPSLTQTSSNGLFALILLEPSIYSVRAQLGLSYLPAQVLPVLAGEVTQSFFDRKDMKTLSLEVFDFSEDHQGQKQKVSILGLEYEKDVNAGIQTLQYPEGLGTFTLEVEGDSRDPILRIHLPHGTRNTIVPLVSQRWLNAVALKKKVNREPLAGTAFGLGPEEEFEVLLEADSQGDVVYVDPSGEVLYQETGVPGGSFALFNLRPGIHEVTLLTKNGSKLFTQVLVSELDVLNVVNFEVR